MKEEIIELSIQYLQKNGLRFSIDEIAKTLKISKKTIYKYFSSKEELAVAIYRQYYIDVNQKLDVLFKAKSSIRPYDLIDIYFRSFLMTKEDIFNKFALNAAVRKLAKSSHEKVWSQISALLPQNEIDTLKIIFDGTFEKLNETGSSPEIILHKLSQLICF